MEPVDCPRSALTSFHEPDSSRLASPRRLVGSLILALAAFCGIVLVGRMAIPYAGVTDFSQKMLAPSLSHPFGTDQMGRDMLARTLAGLSTSLCVGAIATAVTALIALSLALTSAIGGRAGDAAVSWLVDLVMGVPHLVLSILISCALGRGFWGVTVGLALTHWPGLTRVLRAELLRARSKPYIEVSEALGVGRIGLVARHLVPAISAQLVVGSLLAFPHAILHEASITFLGFGLPPEDPALGAILAESMGYLTSGAWWLSVLPGVSLVICVMLLDRVGTALRGVIDVRSVRDARRRG